MVDLSRVILGTDPKMRKRVGMTMIAVDGYTISCGLLIYAMLDLPQCLYALVAILCAYAITGPVRSSVLMLICLVLGLGVVILTMGDLALQAFAEAAGRQRTVVLDQCELAAGCGQSQIGKSTRNRPPW
jgi:hypothetical protein